MRFLLRVRAVRGKSRSREHIVSLVRRDCSQLFCVFTGIDGSLMMSIVDFLRRASLVDRNVTIFRDPFGDDYRHGVGGTVTDFQGLVEWQRRQRQRLTRVTEAYCVGTSMGGLAAIRVGYHLKAKRVWAFAPRPNDWYRGRRSVADLIDLLSTSNGTTEYRIYYSPTCRIDRFVADALASSPGVVCCPQEGISRWRGSHAILPIMVRAGVAIAELFPPFAPAR